MGERAKLLANGLTASKDLKMNKHRKTQIKLDEKYVREDKLLFEQLFLRANTTLSAIVILFLFPFSIFFDPPFFWEAFYII